MLCFLVLFNSFTVTQNIFSRPSHFDGTLPIATVEDALGIKPDKFWLNVPVSPYPFLYYQ